MASESIEEQLLRLETDLLRPEIRLNREALLNILAPDFCEFGSSGRVYSRDEIVNALQAESQRHISIADFSANVLGEAVALATYRAHQSEASDSASAKAPVTSLRSSIWVLRDSRWQLLFHQGTRVAS